jgi:hypothetical protein
MMLLSSRRSATDSSRDPGGRGTLVADHMPHRAPERILSTDAGHYVLFRGVRAASRFKRAQRNAITLMSEMDIWCAANLILRRSVGWGGPPLRDRWFADSLLEGTGFELSVPGKRGNSLNLRSSR